VAATLKSSLEVEDALLRAGDRLGARVLFLRLVAAELPDNPWLLDLQVERRGEDAIARTTHLCGGACVADLTGCLTAFKVEDAVTKRTGTVMALSGVERDGADGLRVTLRPVERPRAA
jgi:hypothetical protein